MNPTPAARPIVAPPPPPFGPREKWVAVALLWFCGFFNYADRQAVFSVFPLLGTEFELDNTAKGAIGSAFMVVYAAASPVTGLLVDRLPRRMLIAAGLAVWSVVCALTGTARSFRALLGFRAAEGLGESCYFPATMSMLADYHGPETRSRAMSLHQTSVYAGTAVGGVMAGVLAQQFGWRSPFWVLGAIGLIYAAWLPSRLREPPRGGSPAEPEVAPAPDAELEPVAGRAEPPAPAEERHALRDLATILRNPAAMALLVAFAGANFVAMTLLAWLPDFVHDKFGLDLTGAAVVGTLFMPSANLIGALLGGVLADRVGRDRPGGRAAVQAAGLLLGAPFVYLVGQTETLPLLIVSLVAIGLFKGVYDANIFAAMYDIVRPEVRGLTAGLMNTVGWAFGSLAPLLIGLTSEAYGLSASIAATAGLYVVAAGLALLAAVLTARSRPA